MAISVNWPTKVISVPKADMTLVQSNPTEIRSLDLNAFRLALKALEDDPEGAVWLDTHSHAPPVDVGGVTLARVVEIINGYTITFEDGQYAVNLVGANSNAGDRVNVNQVSIRSSNSAGLVTSAAIEFGEYGGGVTADLQDITGNATQGSVYPTGTLRQPCDNVTDALVICAARGFATMYVIGDVTIESGHNIDRFHIQGSSHVQNTVTIDADADCVDSVFSDLEVSGTLDGNNELNNCIVGTLTYFSGHIHNCGLNGTITLDGNTSSVLSNCITIDPLSPPTVNMGGSGNDLAMPEYSGLLTITNLSGASNVAGIGLAQGEVVLDSTTVTAGTVNVAGVGELKDETGALIETGTWNGGVTIVNHTTPTHEAVHTVSKLTGNRVSKSGDIITIYEDDGVTVWRQYNLANDGRVQT